jgi:hypothetical protein
MKCSLDQGNHVINPGTNRCLYGNKKNLSQNPVLRVLQTFSLHLISVKSIFLIQHKLYNKLVLICEDIDFQR